MATPPSFPSKLEFGSFLVYPTRANQTEAAQKARSWVIRIKEDRASHLPSLTLIEYTVRRIAETTFLHQLLNASVTFVPMPRSAPLVRDAVWASQSICISLVQSHLGRDWQPLLERVSVCEKSATAAQGKRPVPSRHFDTMRATGSTVQPTSIVMVDDVITHGSTFIGAAARLRALYPNVPIAAFAIARTDHSFTEIRQPCLGEIQGDPLGRWAKRQDIRIL